LRLLILVLSSPGGHGVTTTSKLAEAALRRGHEVNIFFTGEGVENLRRDAEGPSARLLAKLAAGGVRVLACRESARRKGLLTEGDLVEGAEMSSLAGMVELMDSSDRTLVFG